MSTNLVYFVVTLVAVTLAVRFIGPFMGRPRTSWRGSILFGSIMAFIGWSVGV